MASYLDHIDQPSNDGFNTFCVSKMAHDAGLKVVLSGLGGDELFGGYRSFQLVPKLMQVASHIAVSRVRFVELPDDLEKADLDRAEFAVLEAFSPLTDVSAKPIGQLRGFFTPTEAKELVDFYTGGGNDFCRNGCFGHDELIQPTLRDQVSYLEISRYMQNQLLRDSDVMSMAWGLELRVPFVDRKLVDQIARVPAELRLASGKKLLLDAVPEIPSWVAHRPKRGFAFPFEQWMSEDWREVFGEIDRVAPAVAL